MKMVESNFWGFCCCLVAGTTIVRLIDRVLSHREEKLRIDKGGRN